MDHCHRCNCHNSVTRRHQLQEKAPRHSQKQDEGKQEEIQRLPDELVSVRGQMPSYREALQATRDALSRAGLHRAQASRRSHRGHLKHLVPRLSCQAPRLFPHTAPLALSVRRPRFLPPLHLHALRLSHQARLPSDFFSNATSLSQLTSLVKLFHPFFLRPFSSAAPPFLC